MSQLERDVRYLKRYALVASGAIPVLLLSAFAAGRQQTKELSVERLNIVSPDGKLALALAGYGRLPGPMMDGVSYPAELSGGRLTSAGMIFFNESGDEVGGLTFGGKATPQGHESGGSITFDQWKNDQVVGFQYQDDGKSRAAGIQVWDRAIDYPLTKFLPLAIELKSAGPARRDSIRAELARLREDGKLGAHRVFVGSIDQRAMVQLKDRRGRERIRLFVDAQDLARLEFLDPEGKVVATFPAK